jgi:hypothetical protein
VLAAWQKDARVSRNADASTVSASERMFTYLFNGEGGSLLSMDLECSALLSRLHQKFKANPLLIQQVLKDNLSSMLLDSALLRSNGQNLASIFGRIYAFSATPSNFRDFHPKLQMNLQSGLLIESQVMDYLKTQKAIVKENTAKTPIEYLENCVQENDQVRVITDRGSHLRGMVNLEAVKNLATILARLRPAIRYILFYQKDILFAWDLRKNDQQEPKMLRETTPKYIKETLEGCLPADRFTYVDQEHSLGTDLVQDQQACAVLSVDIKTRASSFLQALMRMRALGEGQKIVIIVDSLLMQKIRACGFQSPTDVDVLLTVLKDNEQLELQTDHYPSALNAITNCFRSDLLWRLRTCKNPVLRDQFFVKAEKFFIEWQCHDILALYEHRSEPVKTARLLEIYIKQQRDLWYAIVKDSFLPQEIEKAEVAITEMLDIIFKKAKKICLPEQPSQSFCLGTEVQQQKQMQLRKQLEQVIESKKKPSLLRKLDLQEKTVIQQLTQDLGHKNENIARLMARYQQGWSFDKALYATPNFLYTFANQAKDEIYSFHTQPCFFIFFELNPPDKLKACLVCREEAEILQKFIGEKKSASYWLATISGDALTPVPVLSLGLQMLKNSLLEQAAFFNGRADILISLPSFVWLKHQGEFKLHFWREVVKGPLGISNEQFKRVQSKLYEIAGLVEEWAKYPSGMSPEHWLKKVPEEVRERFQKILVCLSEVRIRIIQSPLNRLSVEQLQERLALQDALLVDQYQNALVVLSQLKAKDYSAAAILFKEKKAALSEGFLDYCFPAAPLLLNDLDNQQLMKNIQEDDTRAAWIAQLLSANASVGLASFIDLQHQLKSVADSAKRDIFFKRILVAKIKGTQNLEEIFVFVKAVAAAVPVSNTINVLHILSEDNVQEKELLLQVLTDTDFCEYVDKLMLLNKKTKKSKEEYVPLLLAFLKLWKQNTEKLKDRLQVSGIGDAILLHAGPYLQQCFDGVINDQAWEACCELMQPGISDDFMIRALYDPELQNNIEFLKTGGYIARLGALQHQPHFFKVVTALREAHCCATIVEKAALSPLICSLVLTLQEDKLVQPKVLVAILHCGADDLLLLKTRLEYLKEKMLVAIVADIPEALTTNVLWDGIKSLQEARIDDPILVKQALKDNNFSANLQYLSSYCQSYQLQLADTFTVLIEAQGDVSRIAAALHHVESIGITAYEKKQILTDQAVWKGIDLLTNAGIVDKKIVEAALYNADFRELLKVLDAVGFQGGDLQIVSSLYYAYATSLDILQKNLVYLQKIGIDLERANDCVRGLLYPARWRVLIELREANVKDAAVVAQLLFDYDFIDLLPQLKKVGLIQNALPVALLKKRKGELRYLNKLLEIGVIDKTNSSLLEDDVHWRAVNAFDGVIIEPSVIRRVLTDVFFEAAILNFFVKQGLEKKRLPVAFLIKRANDKDFTAILDYLQQQKFVDVNHLAALLRDKTWSELLFCQRNGITDNTFIERVFTDPHFSEFIQPLESLLLIFPVKDLPFKLLMQRRTKEDLLLLQELALGTFLDENRIRLLGEDLVWVAIKNLCTAIPKAEIKGFIQQAYDDVGFQLILPVLVRAGYRQDQLITLLKQRQGQFSTVSYLEQYKISDTGKRRAFTTDAAWVAVRILQQANVNDAFLLEKAISNTDFQQVLTLLQSQGFSLDSLLLRKRIDQIVLLKKLIERNIIFPANIALLLDDDVWTALENLELAKIQDNFLATMMTMNPAYRATLRLLVRQGYAQDSLRDLLVKRDVSVLSYLVQQPLDEKLKIQALIQDFAWSAVELLAKAAPYFNQELIALTEQAITDANFQFLMTLLKAQGYLGSSFPLGVVVKRKKELATLGYVRNVGSYNNSILAHLFTDDCGWTTLRALEDAKVSDSALIMLADNAVFQQVVALLLKGCRSSIDLPLALLNQCKLNSAPLKTILEHLDASGLLDPDRHPDTLSRLVDPSIQSGLQVLVGAKVTDHSLLDLALRGDPDYKAVMSYLQSIADPGFTVSLCFLQLHKKNLRQGLLMLELLQEICSLDAVHIEIACKEAEAVQALAALRQANIHDKPQIVHALHKPALVVAKLILQESGLENSFLAAAVEIDRQLKEKLEAKYNRAATGGPAHLTPWTIAVIQQINTIKQRYEANPLYANYRVSIQSFAHETLNVLLDNDGDLNRPKAQQQIVAGFRKAADKHFKHRHLALRIVSDLLLALTVAGLLVHLGRKLSGRTFFFSTAQTARQSDFEQALAKTPSCLPR